MLADYKMYFKYQRSFNTYIQTETYNIKYYRVSGS